MGTHRSTGSSREISKGPVITAGVVVVLVAAALVWSFSGSDSDGASAGDSCSAGEAVLDVTVDPEIADPVRTVAARYNRTRPVVRDHCAKVVITERSSADIVAAFTSHTTWDPTLGPRPGLWIPVSSRHIASMRTPGLVEGSPRSIGSSPIVLAVPEVLRHALAAGQTSWVDLPGLQQGSLDAIGLPDWGGLKLALPPGDTTLAVAAAVAGAVSGTDPVTVEAVGTGQAISAVSGLAEAAPEIADPSAALATLTSAAPAEADVHAVPVTQRLLEANGGNTASYAPVGAAPAADYPAAVLSGPWVDRTQNLIAGLFAEYLRQPDQQNDLMAAGLEAPPAQPVAAPPREALDRLRAVLDNPVLGVHATALLDTSASMETADGELTRLNNTVAALASTLTVMPPEFGLGIRTFGGAATGDPYEVIADTAALDDTQRSTLMGSLGSIEAGTDATDQCYPALIATYRNAVESYAADRTNSILLVTDGPEDRSGIGGEELLSTVDVAGDPATPIRVDVIVIGGAGADALRTLTERTGGSYTVLPSSDDLAFGTAMVSALTNP